LREQPLLLERALEFVGHLVEPSAVGAVRRSREPDRADQAAVTGGVAAVVGAEHPALDADLLAALAALAGQVLGGEFLLGVHPVRIPGCVVAHRSSPFISIVGRALSAASSASRAASSALTPSLEVRIFSWSLRMASISISGRGGQPGR